ncbi:MAG TPA: hypothetical protein VFI20_09350 [Terracidiphilus sp.]|nr:hypothetical protein [Terracidiphilus sp.]
MIDRNRATQWAKDAEVFLMQRYGKDEAGAHLATVVIALLADREERERYCSRISPPANALELVAGE